MPWLFSQSKLDRCTSERGLRRMLMAAERHVAQATTIGWPALAQSWKRDAERIKARMAQFKETA
jgi:hypothetical protein